MTHHLPTHPFTGLTALGLRRDGRPIWPVLGGAPDEPPTPPTPPAPPAPPTPPVPPADPAADDKPLGPNGEKALAAEREGREQAEKAIRALAQALGGGKPGDGKTDIERLTERFEQQQKDLVAERAARFKSEVAVDKKLSASQAALLIGSTREEMSAHADKLLAEFGKTADPDPARRGGMRPDPAQGARPGGKPSGKEAGLAEAQRRFKKT